MNITETGIAVLAASACGMIAVIFKGLRLSRCSNLNVCFGCIKCEREIMSVDEHIQEITEVQKK